MVAGQFEFLNCSFHNGKCSSQEVFGRKKKFKLKPPIPFAARTGFAILGARRICGANACNAVGADFVEPTLGTY